jgi:hypothetical protein
MAEKSKDEGAPSQRTDPHAQTTTVPDGQPSIKERSTEKAGPLPDTAESSQQPT